MSSKEAQTEGHLRARPVRVTWSAPVGLQPLMLSAARQLPVRASDLPCGSPRPVGALAARRGRAHATGPGLAAEPSTLCRADTARLRLARSHVGPARRPP